MQSVPGQQAVINGALWLKNTATGATVRNLTVHGAAATNAWAMLVQADNATVSGIEMDNLQTSGGTNAICVLAGRGFEQTPANTVTNLLVEESRIHDCGNDDHEHSIYLESTRNAVVRDNVMYGNSGYAIHMYPDAQP